MARFAASAGAVLAVWGAVLLLETSVVSAAYRAYFAGSWETSMARTQVVPIGVALLVPWACVVVALAWAARLARGHDRARRGLLAAVAVLFGGATAYGVSFGRHMANLTLRGAFIMAVASSAGVATWMLAPRAVRWVRRANAGALVGVAAVSGALFWCADAFVLPRLYPAFHAALGVLALVAFALAAVPVTRSRAGRVVGVVVLALAALSALRVGGAAAKLAGADNLRLILVERAPLLGTVVRIASLLHPPDAESDDSAAPTAPSTTAEGARALDWSGHDIVLLTVDALRADHVSAYGYGRVTTPAIDALAREGALFDAAYCPTPHTSYSVTSLMTGKYMRPLLALGRGEDSETWAALLRRYGYRTAAFYPPAVFFIDEERFTRFRDRGLDFEYRKVEFAGPDLHASQIDAYLTEQPAAAGRDANDTRPLFLWVHFFEPHEPYVAHDAYPFGDPGRRTDVDAYDSEIAEADHGIGAVVARVRARRPNAVVIVTADHGEEFGEHGGRYHGTTVYEEQVRVPLVVVGPGVVGGHVTSVVQTVDLLPTVLSALGIPRPARVRGRDLGAVLAATGTARTEPGLAFSETDDYTLVAQGDARLVCARKIGACALHRLPQDPLEQRDITSSEPALAKALREGGARIAREHGKYEPVAGGELPEALRRGMQGDAEAAEEVAALLDDARLSVRRKAAEVSFELHAEAALAQLQRGFARADDDETKRFCALALVRMGAPPSQTADALLTDANREWRRRAALAFGARGDARGGDELTAYWRDEAPPKAGGTMPFERQKELLAAFVAMRWKRAAPLLVASLEDVRLRPAVADALGKLADPQARGPLAIAFANERYVHARIPEAQALAALGARDDLRTPLARFAGLPQPMLEAITIARDADLLAPVQGGLSFARGTDGGSAPTSVDGVVTIAPSASGHRLIVLLAKGGEALTGAVDGAPFASPAAPTDPVRVVDASALAAASDGLKRDVKRAIRLESTAGILGLWVVPRSQELPPPPPAAWSPPPAESGVRLETASPP